MLNDLRRWWYELGYCWDRRQGEFRYFGLRPFKRFYWLVIDDSGTAERVRPDDD